MFWGATEDTSYFMKVSVLQPQQKSLIDIDNYFGNLGRHQPRDIY
jgi:hypothetical protein